MSSEVETNVIAAAPAPRTELVIGGMTCQNCARHVTEALRGVSGVGDALVDLSQGKARVDWQPQGQPDVAALQRAVAAAGYTAKPVAAPADGNTVLRVQGMDCQSCVRKITTALQQVPGVDRVAVDLGGSQATVHWRAGGSPNPSAALAAVQQAGYKAELVTASPEAAPATDSVFAGWRLNVLLGSAVTLALMIGEWVFRLGTEHWYQWTALVLATPVQVLCGARFYRGAWNQLKVGGSNMDTLVALGSTTAFAYSVVGLFAGWHGHLYFMEAAAIITLISVGHWMESLVSAKAAGSLKALLNLAPAQARKLAADGTETEVPVASLLVNDRIILKPGDRVPTDGNVVEGGSAVDEAMLTGESLPVDKRPGDRLYAGTVNQNGRLVMRVVATGEATALAQIIAVVQRAQNSRADIQKLGDRVSSVFVPVVVLIALATAAWWGLAGESAHAASHWLGQYLWAVSLPEAALAAAVVHAAAVLIVSCPCAMGLATPAAIMAGTNAAAKRGILIRDGAALEKSGTITAVLFDKTGTLTKGEVSVVQVHDWRTENERDLSLEKLAAALARASNHPLSQAVAKLDPIAAPLKAPAPMLAGTTAKPAVGNLLSVQFRPSSSAPQFVAWEEVRGAGVQAQWSQADSSLRGLTVRMGSLNWLREQGVDLQATDEWVREWTGKGATVLGVAADKRLLGGLALRDELKSGAADVVAQLAKLGHATYLVTGDNALTAAAIARQAGIPEANVFAEVRPERKAEMVQQLQQRGERVAFVGDGINDAPALEQADLGIAVAKASDVAREAADIILLKSDIQAIPEALGLAQATLRTIKQNLFWAFFYNSAAIPLAVLGFLSPVVSAAAMGVSDLIVIGNALRLLRWRLPRQ